MNTDTTRPDDIPPGEGDGEGDTCDVVAQMSAALCSLDKRLREFSEWPLTAGEAYDSFYQGIVADALTAARAALAGAAPAVPAAPPMHVGSEGWMRLERNAFHQAEIHHTDDAWFGWAARAALAAQPQEPGQSVAGRWIAVTDQLPDFDEGDVIVYTADHDFGGEQFHQIEGADFYYRDEDRPDDEMGTEVARVATHWMPASLARPWQPPPQEPAREPSPEEIQRLAKLSGLPPRAQDDGSMLPDPRLLVFARAVRAWKPEEGGRGA